MKRAILVLEDGTTFEGRACGAAGEAFGRCVYNTSAAGYQEALSSPSSAGNVIAFTYPEIGAYGVNSGDAESGRIHAAAAVFKRLSPAPSSWRAEGSLRDYLVKNRVVAAENMDTRAVLRHIRKRGEMNCILTTKQGTAGGVLKRLKSFKARPAADAPVKKEYTWPAAKTLQLIKIFNKESSYIRIVKKPGKFRVAVIDCGVNESFLRMLASAGCGPVVMPAQAKAEQLLKRGIDGVFISNGPGGPALREGVAAEVRKVAGKKPILGIGLGCQILALALGGKVYEMKSGHRGANHSVKNLRTGSVEVVSQDHGYAIDKKSFPKNSGVSITHINLNDGTVEGIEAAKLKCFGVQYYPQARPGAHDAPYVFGKFIDYMR